MTPSVRFAGLCTFLTIFSAVSVLTSDAAQAAFSASEARDSGWAATIGALLSSVGLYRGIEWCLRWLLTKSTWLRSLFLGPYDVGGTWIGSSSDSVAGPVLVVEHIEQDLDSVRIRGYSYSREDSRPVSIWRSTAAAVNADEAKLEYAYSGSQLSNSVDNQGVVVYFLVRASAKDAPRRVQGFFVDAADGKRYHVEEERVSKDLLDPSDALLKAREKFRI